MKNILLCSHASCAMCVNQMTTHDTSWLGPRVLYNYLDLTWIEWVTPGSRSSMNESVEEACPLWRRRQCMVNGRFCERHKRLEREKASEAFTQKLWSRLLVAGLPHLQGLMLNVRKACLAAAFRIFLFFYCWCWSEILLLFSVCCDKMWIFKRVNDDCVSFSAVSKFNSLSEYIYLSWSWVISIHRPLNHGGGISSEYNEYL